MAIQTVGVIGCGLMGSGIAQVSAQAGFPTIVIEADQQLLDRGLAGIKASLDALVAKAKINQKARDDAVARLTGSTRLEELKGCDLVIEAITENQALKNETFARLDAICPPHTLLASNTSSCNVTELAAATKRPSQVLGLHFFNPAPVTKLVSEVRTILTSEATPKAAGPVVESLGKTPLSTQ